MKSTKIMIEKIREINFKRMNQLANYIAKKNNKSPMYVKLDMFKNFLQYKIGYTDYFKSDYINLTKKQKEDFVTSRNFFNILAYLNPRPYRVLTKDKLVFNKLLKDYIKRDFLDVRTTSEEELKTFIKGKQHVFAKPHADFGGKNIEKIKVKDIKDIKKFKEQLLNNKQYLLEDEIIQHKKVHEINPNAVNTFRIITLYKDGKAHVLANSFRISLDENAAIQCWDAYMRLNEDGTPACKFIDDAGEIFDTHPLTGFDFNTIKKIPYVKESFEMVKEAACLIPEIRYIGWDVAITEDGPVVIEGNEYPSYGLIQNYLLNKDNPGHLKAIREVLGDEMKNIKLNN